MMNSNTEQELDRLGVEKIYFVGEEDLDEYYKDKYYVELIYSLNQYKINFLK